ncbi:MAG: hypothetical protein KZQ60_11595 [Candidatus Thiodiazotropha sp. (ex Lucinoma aequizonata)]|nr:hypothetical protein [Candidatus Thiodiazotropha sp. (ex Lucinoma aequizonata)]
MMRRKALYTLDTATKVESAETKERSDFVARRVAESYPLLAGREGP